MTYKTLVLLAAGGSAALLAGAYLFQYAGYPPCQMCYWQRWPHFAAVAIGAATLVFGIRALAWLGAAAAAVTSGIGIYHTGVERDWWEGPTSCSGDSLGSLAGNLLSTDGPRLVMCDQVSWELFTLSMASWNALFSAILVVLWIMAARRTT